MKKGLFTIPNILSFFRILLIPVTIILFIYEHYHIAAGVIVLSGITDVLDGMIARKFNMVSDVGKILDPVADKLTQVCILVCMAIKFPYLIIAFSLLAIKEVAQGCTSLVFLKKGGQPISSEWHGKATTVSIYLTIMLHLIWNTLPQYVTIICVSICSALIITSFILYMIRFTKKANEN